MNEMIITSAQYTNDPITNQREGISFVCDGKKMWVKNDATSNRHYDEIMRQVEAGTLTIQEAD